MKNHESYLEIARRVMAHLSSHLSHPEVGDTPPPVSSHVSHPHVEINRFSKVVRRSSLSSMDTLPVQDVHGGAKKAKEAKDLRSRDDGRRIWIRAMGEVLDHPRLGFDRGRAILPGLEAWEKFTAHASPADMALAVAVLLTVDAVGDAVGTDAPGGRRRRF